MLDLDSKNISKKLRKQAFELKHQRLSAHGLRKASQSLEPPDKNWPGRFLERHKEQLQVEKIVGLGWRRRSTLWGTQVADFVASDVDVNHLCWSCAKVEAKLERMLNKARPNESRRVHVFEAVLASVFVSSCKLCCFVLACSTSWGWPNAVKYSLKIHHMEHVFGPTSSENKLLLGLAIEDEHMKGVHRGWIVPVPAKNSGDVGKKAWGPLQSNVNFTVIQEWLGFCESNHSESCGATACDDIPFFRLIDCVTHSIVDAPPNSRFAALSYCWGPPDPSSQHEVDGNGLPNNVPLVIQDALTASQKLGIPYLWVDRYCIKQDETSPIKPIQLQNMHKVYRSAYVTIIAACGHGPDFGFPGITSRARKAQLSVNTHGHQLLCIPDILQEIWGCTWSTRGWTLQENYFSRRRLVITESQTYFQCRRMHCCEAIPTCLARAHTKDLKRFRDSSQTFRVFPPSGIGRTGAEIDNRIHEYLPRILTKDSDALKAFLGVFQAFRELENPVIDFWGLPMSKVSGGRCDVQRASNFSALEEMRASFLSSLAWSENTCSLTSLRILFQRPDFPSWSWAAWRTLRTFSRKSIPMGPHSPRVSFRSLQNVAVGLEEYEHFLGPNTSITLLQPCIVVHGWVTKVWFAEESHGEGHDPLFTVQSPIPTNRVSLIMNAKTAVHLRRQCQESASFQVLLLGGDLGQHDGRVPLHGWKDVHAIVLHRLPDKTYMRLGVVTWSLLGQPFVDERNGTMRVKELFKARRVFPQCQCGCRIVDEAIFEQYLEDDTHVMEWKKTEFLLV